MGMAFDCLLTLLILGVAAWTLAARRTFSAVAGFLVYGLALSLAWVRLSAPDIALTEAAIGGGLTGVLLLGAAARLRPAEDPAPAERPGKGLRLAAAAVSATLAVAVAVAVLALPEPAPTLAPAAAEHLASTGLGNAVTAVLLAYRAMDTLLETVVLLFALIGVWSLARDSAWGGRPGLRQAADPQGALAFLARVLAPMGLLVGLYLFWVGADHPGGKFQAATILAAMGVLLVMAGLVDIPPVSRTWVRAVLVAGPLLFLAIGIAGFWIADAFLAYPEGQAKPFILVIEAALVPSIALMLGLLLAGPPARKEEP